MSEHTHTHAAPTGAVRRLERSSNGRLVAGVSEGLGRYFDLNPAFFRIGFIVLTLLGGTGILIYLASVLVIPDESKERSFAEQVLAERRDRPWPLAGLVLVGVAILITLSHATVWPAAGAGWVLVLIAGLGILWVSRGERRLTRVVRMLTALTVLGLATVIAAIALAFTWFKVSLADGVGDHVYNPAAAADVRPAYNLGIGKLQVDLSDIGPVAQATHIDMKVGIGKLLVIVPNGVNVAVVAHARAGDITVLNHHDDGRNADIKTGAGLLEIDATVGAGKIEVVRAAG